MVTLSNGKVAGIQACADKLSVSPTEIWAVLRIETRGVGYFVDRRPAILFERHVFSRRTNGRRAEEGLSGAVGREKSAPPAPRQ